MAISAASCTLRIVISPRIRSSSTTRAVRHMGTELHGPRPMSYRETMAATTIRRATAEDWEMVARLHAASWRSAYRGIYPDRFLDDEVIEDRRNYWRGALPDMIGDRDAVFLAGCGREPAGFVCIRRDQDPAGPLLDNLHVLPGRKRRGTGRRLLAAGAAWLVDQAPDASLQLFVWAANRPARGFYRHLGAIEVEQLDQPVPGGEIAPIVRMRWLQARALLEPIRGG
jgi:ribosomal protein S18 acetylase RimI-like enzyme